jgi:hypothetical protein
MSDLIGSGYGDSHDWTNEGVTIHGPGVGNKFSEWTCKNCKAYFRHFYDRDNLSIYKIIKRFNVPDKCPGAL